MNLFLPSIAAACSLMAQTPRDLRYERDAAPLPDKRVRWALVAGVSAYKYASPSAQLRYAHRDAEEFARFLRSPQGGGIPAPNVRLLTDGQATLAALRSALQEWLPRSAGPNDVVYLFLAGHAVVADGAQTYFVAHDSDPQNLHATGLSFAELNQVLTAQLKSSLVVLIADACHAGGIGWTSDPASPSRAHGSLESLGDRSILKMLASRPTERSFEDTRWGGGHGIFTYALLNGLRGAAERVPDGVVRASELIDHVSRVVPEQTGSKQNPRIAGNFEGALPMALLPAQQARPAPVETNAALKLAGPPGAGIYIDDRYQGSIRPAGELVVSGLRPGVHLLSVDEPGFETLEQEIRLASGETALNLETAKEFALPRLRRLIAAGRVLDKDGAWDRYRAQNWPSHGQAAAAAAAVMAAALEEVAQACVTDYVQSTTNSLKVPMFLQAAEAYRGLKTFRPEDRSLDAKGLFCQARAQIATGDFAPAVETLRQSLAIDPAFACSHNALGVALGRLGNAAAARQAFEKARSLTPHWALPPLQLAQQWIAANDPTKALPYLEEAARLNPKAIGILWSLARLNRVLGRDAGFVRAAEAAQRLDRDYAPMYAELGLFYENAGDRAKAAQAFDAYLTLAPNYADSNEIRERAQRLRSPPARPAPTLRKK